MLTKHAGLSLMAGIILSFVGALFMPGNLINTVNPTDYHEAVQAMGDPAILAQWMTFISLVGTLFMVFGALGLYPLATSQGGLAGRLLQFGIIASVIEWSVLIIATGMRHFAIHLLQRAELGDFGSMTAGDFADGALVVHIAMIGITLTFMALFPLATLLTGIGLAGRFGSMDIYKIASYLLVLGGIVGLVNFIVAINAPEVGLDLLLYVNSVVLYIGGICLFIIGFGMYKGRSELTADVA